MIKQGVYLPSSHHGGRYRTRHDGMRRDGRREERWDGGLSHPATRHYDKKTCSCLDDAGRPLSAISLEQEELQSRLYLSSCGSFAS